MPRHPISDADRSDDSLKDMVEWEREMARIARDFELVYVESKD